ncbi:cofilin [Penicillium chermesinum]|uniref:Cofilin n=1 Tax=Penicillium chermesinum TaxID=63820 RepID=A0A9W9PIE0_9EURO|nr:cofilin [Penicillium chermesinum]KAJ5246722.1 cofilin [Penicillium chermesinum]
MSLASGVTVTDECINKFNEFRLSHGKIKYIIFKISDDKKTVVVDDFGAESDYEVFLYDVEYDLGGGEGKRSKIIFISWVPTNVPTLWSMIYASTRENLRNALNVANSIHADDKSEIEWKAVLKEASGGKAN